MDPFVGKRLRHVVESDLNRLIADGVPESLYLDYKQILKLDNKDEKKEFLRDVTSFANADGGLLVYGVEEERDATGKPTGIPSGMPGFNIANWDAFNLVIEQLLKDGIDERLPRYEIRNIPLSAGVSVLLIRVPPSLRAPHMVILSGERRFFMRTNGGKQDMSTAQIRDGVLRTESVEERVRRFIGQRTDRIRTLTNGRPYWTLHVIPLVRDASAIDVTRDDIYPRLQAMLTCVGGTSFHCLEGFKMELRYGDGLVGYGLMFRDGSIEFVDLRILASREGDRPHTPGLVSEENHKFLPHASFDNMLFDFLCAALSLYADGLLRLPCAICITLDRVAEYSLPLPFGRATNKDETISTDPLVVSELDADPRATVKPLLDFIWNAFGKPRCIGYDQAGKYVGYR